MCTYVTLFSPPPSFSWRTSGATAANSATTANNPNSIVKRDAGGNFSATSFSGSLNGNVTGTQNATVVSSVGGQTAGAVAATVGTVNAATPINTLNTIVKRDGVNGGFFAGTVDLQNLSLPDTTATAGTISFAGARFLHRFGLKKHSSVSTLETSSSRVRLMSGSATTH